jgi:hypothetical protein
LDRVVNSHSAFVAAHDMLWQLRAHKATRPRTLFSEAHLVDHGPSAPLARYGRKSAKL